MVATENQIASPKVLIVEFGLFSTIRRISDEKTKTTIVNKSISTTLYFLVQGSCSSSRSIKNNKPYLEAGRRLKGLKKGKAITNIARGSLKMYRSLCLENKILIVYSAPKVTHSKIYKVLYKYLKF